MAQGKGSRWGSEDVPAEYKQLILVNEEVLIKRTIRQLIERGLSDITVIANGDFAEHTSGILRSLHEPTGSINQGLLALYKDWEQDGYTLFILGDVIFSEEAMNIIKDNREDFRLFARPWRNAVTGKEAREIFAVKIYRTQLARFQRLLQTLVNEDAPKLWNMYDKVKYMSPFPVEFIDDWTDDIDSPQEYDEFFYIMEQCAKEEYERL